ncbi:MAG: c-type cytochrome [Pseudomonadota bacterium]
MRCLTVLIALLAAPSLAEPPGDVAAGEQLYRKCASCHALGKGAKHKVGPHLNAIFGRRAAGIAGFRYSGAMKRAGADGLVWTAETLDAYLENPESLVTGTRMSFRGLKGAEERAAVLAYLRQVSDNSQDVPETGSTATASLPLELLNIEGDPAWGEYLSSECTTCHRADGEDDGIPSITRWPTEDFVVAMHAYKDKIRPHPIMQMMAGRLSNEEIAALAAYFEGLAPQ